MSIYEVWSKNNLYLQFFQKIFIYLSITILSPSKKPLSDIIHLCQHFFQPTKYFWDAIFGIANSSCCDFVFQSWLFWTLSLRWLGFNFNVIICYQSWPFWENVDRRWTSSTSPERYLCYIAKQSMLPHVSCLKYPWKVLGMSRTIYQHHQQPL